MAVEDRITAIGGTAIAGLTLVAASYLLFSILSRARGGSGSQLRVRFLAGIIVSDIIIGVVALPSEALFVARRPLRTGTVQCNVQAWLYTTTIFAQNLWSAAIAFATFMLLKHPLHRITAALERHSLLVWLLLWGVSILHSGIWFATIGFANASTLCSYASRSGIDGLDRDLMYFIPRTLVFAVIAVLYSRLFRFLRRPDTIQLSSGMEALEEEEETHESESSGAVAIARRVGSCLRCPCFGLRRPPPAHNPAAPWETLSFAEIAQYTTIHGTLHRVVSRQSRSASRTRLDETERRSPSPSPSPSPNSGPSPPRAESASRPPQAQHPPHPCLPDTASTPGTSDEGSTQEDPRRQCLCAMASGKSTSEEKHDCVVVETNETSAEGEATAAAPARGTTTAAESEASFTLCEFLRHEDDAPRLGTRTTTHLSATAYFNRQASLLMLWFPLAYMAAFSVSVIRLIFKMVNKHSSPALRVLGAWMVLGIGLADAAVFGLAEVVVRRRVRREMPDHFG